MWSRTSSAATTRAGASARSRSRIASSTPFGARPPYPPSDLGGRVRMTSQAEQATATPSAAQTCRMRPSLRRPKRSTSVPIETLSTESRLTAESIGIGSSPGSSTTSLGILRTVVVHGPIKARRSLGIAASRDKTTTGRRAISGSSHHQTSPLAGSGVTMPQRQHGMMQGLPTHQPPQVGARRRRRKQHQARRSGNWQEAQ